MRKYLFVILYLFIGHFTQAQQSEFVTYKNGLMYHDTTVAQLRHIVDSLNLKHKVCDLDRKYYAQMQAKGNYITIASDDIKKALIDLKNNISYENLITKYPKTKIDDELVIVKFQYKNYNNKEVVSYNSLGFGSNDGYKVKESIHDNFKKGQWIIDHFKKTSYSEESLSAFYLSTDFESQLIPEKYARMLQYSECLIDTTTDVFMKNAKRGGLGFFQDRGQKKKPAIDKLIKYFHKETNKPKETKSQKFDDYWKVMRIWDSTKYVYADKYLANDKTFLSLLAKAEKEAISNGGSTNELEALVGKYLSKEKELQLKRNRIVVGGCSQDMSPRYHARDIAILAAETVKWEVFLRAHLNIMNDRFDRASDGSYAWAGRNTYIKELEELNIDVPKLLFGVLLRVKNPSSNHYYGSVRRLGRAMAETKNPAQLEASMLGMIQDESLDDYNRVLMYYLFENYNYNLDDSNAQQHNKQKLQQAIDFLPDYIKVRIQSKHHKLERLLRDEIELIKKHFTITKSFVGSMYSYDWDGDECWSAGLKLKNNDKNIKFYTTMKNNNAPGSIEPLLNKKDNIISRLQSVSFLMKQLKTRKENIITVRFVIDQSFSEAAQKSFKEDMPAKFDDTILKSSAETIVVDLVNKQGDSRWLLFPNNKILLWHYSNDPPLKQYSEEELKVNGDYIKNVYKYVDLDGQLIK